MEKVNRQPKIAPRLRQTQTVPARDPTLFNAFLSGFTKEEQKQFLKNMTRHFTHIVMRHMRKMKEANERMKESFQKK